MVKLVELVVVFFLLMEVPTVPASARAPVTLRALAAPPPPAAATILRGRRHRQPRRMYHLQAPEPPCPAFNLIATRPVR